MEAKISEPTLDLIKNGAVSEGQHYEFKARVDLDGTRGKSNFIDDVIAFLNAGPGHLIVGVCEKEGPFRSLRAAWGAKDALQRRSHQSSRTISIPSHWESVCDFSISMRADFD